MTTEEALEYLNLPPKPRKQLVRKRYLELKRDYLKAIYNAPSDHFCTLYQENLEKIEEAYTLLSKPSDVVAAQGADIQESISGLQKLVDSVQNKGDLSSESRAVIEQYIVQIDHLKRMLAAEDPVAEPVNLSPPSSRWVVNPVENLSDQHISQSAKQESQSSSITKKGDDDTISQSEAIPDWMGETSSLPRQPEPDETVEPNQSAVKKLLLNQLLFFEDWIIHRIIRPAHRLSPGARQQFYSQLVMGVVVAIVILGVLGFFYIMFPLLFR